MKRLSFDKSTLRLTPLTGALAALLLVSSLGACSSTPTLGDSIRAQGAELATIGDQWSEGNDLIEEGREQIEDGQDMVAKGKRLISKGEALAEKGEDNVQRGQEMKRGAEATYRQKTGRELPTS